MIDIKLQQALAEEIKHYIDCPITNTCERCNKLLSDIKKLKIIKAYCQYCKDMRFLNNTYHCMTCNNKVGYSFE